MLAGTAVAVRPIEGVSRRFTIPLNPFIALTVKVEFPFAPARITMVVGLLTTAKSTTRTVTVVVCIRVPLEPLIVTV
jgi:hypothetical protein